MNEQHEINGDAMDDINEAEEAARLAPEQKPLTDEEINDWWNRPDAPLAALTARAMVDIGMDPDEADRMKESWGSI